MSFDPESGATPALEAINMDASVLMKRGIALMDEGRPAALPEILDCFDRAIALRQTLPRDVVPRYGYALAAGWLNRGDALTRLGGGTRLPEAVRCYDEAIGVLRPLPMGHDPRYPRRLAMAYHNRGLAIDAGSATASGAAARLTAVADFTRALDVLQREEAAAIPDRQYLQSVIWLNLARVRCADPATPALAEEAARRAIGLCQGLDQHDAEAAEVSIKARHLLCRALVARLTPAAHGAAIDVDAVHAATDAVDEGLELARRWERAGEARFRACACDLFRFGTRVYAAFQPQFLNEFIQDNLDPGQSSAGYVASVEIRAAVAEAIALARRQAPPAAPTEAGG